MTPVQLSDLDDLLPVWADPEVTRFTVGRPLSREEVWFRLLRDIGHWQAMQFGSWALRLRDTNAFVGSMGVFDYQRALVPAFGAPEVGWALATAYHGKGLANEALGATLGWADRNVQSAHTVCMIADENLPSIKLAHAHGFTPYGQGQYHGATVGLYQRARREVETAG